MNYTIIKNTRIVGAKGDNGDAPTSDITVPLEGIFPYDGETAPTGYEITTPPTPTPVDPDLYRWDFTKSLIDEVQGAEATLTNATRDNNGVLLSAATSCLRFLNEDISINDKSYTIDIEVGESNASFGSSNGRFLMFTNSRGYIYRGALSRWAFYSKNNTWVDASWSSRGQKNIFNNSNLKAVLENNSCYIYLNDVLVQTFNNVTDILFNSIGNTNGNTFYNITIKSLRIYETPSE